METRRQPCLSGTDSVPPRDSAEEVLRRSLQVRSAPLMQTMIDAMPGGVVILNPKLQVIAANRAFLQVACAKLDDVLGLRMGETLGCPFAIEGCGVNPSCRTCGVLNSVRHCQYTRCEASGTCDIMVDRPIKGSSVELRVVSSVAVIGGEECVVCALEDIGTRKRLAELSTLFFHDVLNTLGAVQGHLDQFNGRLPDVETRDDLVRLRYLVDQLADEILSHRELTQAEAGDLEVHPDVVRIKSFVADLRRMYSLHAVGEERRIETSGVWDGLVISDLRLLGRVLGNMLRNALEATESGGTVSIACAAEGEEVVFRVHNAGVIPENLQAELFRRPFSTKGRRHRGIGTRSMKVLGERYLRGTVGFASEASAGTTFWLRVPKVLLVPSYDLGDGWAALEAAEQ